MLIAILLATLLQATSETGRADAITPAAKWVRKPSGADIEKVYPSGAWDRGQSGRAAIGCSVAAKGRLTDCKILSEDPEGAGFGEATLKLSEKFRMAEVIDGKATEGGTVRIPVNFRFGLGPGAVRTSAARLLRADGLAGQVTVRCRVAGDTAKPQLEACAVLESTSKDLHAEALAYASKLPLPSGTPAGLLVTVPVVFGGN